MKRSLFWAAFEAGAKAVRSGLSTVGALVDCGIPRQHAGAQWLTEKEAEEEVAEPVEYCAGFGPILDNFVGEPVFLPAVESAFHSGGQTYCTRCSQRIPQHPTGAGLCVCTPKDSRTNAGATCNRAVEETSEGASPPAAPSDVLADSWVAIAIPVIAEVLAEHKFLPIMGRCECPLLPRVADWQRWSEHVAPHIADRLETVTLALPEAKEQA